MTNRGSSSETAATRKRLEQYRTLSKSLLAANGVIFAQSLAWAIKNPVLHEWHVFGCLVFGVLAVGILIFAIYESPSDAESRSNDVPDRVKTFNGLGIVVTVASVLVVLSMYLQNALGIGDGSDCAIIA